MLQGRARFARSVLTGLVVVMALTVAGIIGAQVKQGKSRVLMTRHLMRGLVAPQCSALKKGLNAGPSDEDAWDLLSQRAELLNEASFILMEDGRCPDGTWANAASKVLRSESANVVKAIGEKNLEAAKASFKAMTGACGACHKAHKKKRTS